MLPDPLEAVLLDFDHTLCHIGHLVDWDAARAAMLPVYRRAGVPHAFLGAHGGALGLYRDVAASDILSERELRGVQREASRVLETFEMPAAADAPMIPAAVEFVRRLPELGLRAAIVSSNTAALVTHVLEREGLRERFEAVVGRDDVALLKPSPEGIFLCCKVMAVVPARCVYAGDNVNDIEAAVAAGMPAFGLRGGNSPQRDLLAAGAADAFADLSGLLDLIAPA